MSCGQREDPHIRPERKPLARCTCRKELFVASCNHMAFSRIPYLKYCLLKTYHHLPPTTTYLSYQPESCLHLSIEFGLADFRHALCQLQYTAALLRLEMQTILLCALTQRNFDNQLRCKSYHHKESRDEAASMRSPISCLMLCCIFVCKWWRKHATCWALLCYFLIAFKTRTKEEQRSLETI